METKDAVKLDLIKEFSAGVETLYEAWTSKEALSQWWHPMNNNLTQLTNELYVQGKVEYDFSTPAGAHAFTITGNYKEVQAAAKLVYTWNWKLDAPHTDDTDFLLTIIFSPNGAGSRLQVTQEQFTTDEAVHPHREGWEAGLESLEKYLAQNK